MISGRGGPPPGNGPWRRWRRRSGRPGRRVIMNADEAAQEWERWLVAYARHLGAERRASPATVRAYAADLRSLREAVPGRAPAAVGRDDLRAWLYHRAQAGVGARSLARGVAAVRGFFQFLEREGGRADNPARRLLAPRYRPGLPRVLTEEEVRRLIEDGTRRPGPLGLRDRAALELLYAAGLRASELTGLTLGDLRPEERLVQVRGKGGRTRLVPYGRAAAAALAAYLNAGRPRLGGGGAGGAALPQRAWGCPQCAVPSPHRRRRRPAGRDRPPPEPPLAAAFLRHPSAERRGRPAVGPGAAGSRASAHHPGLHPSVPGISQPGLPAGAPAGRAGGRLRGREGRRTACLKARPSWRWSGTARRWWEATGRSPLPRTW
ncbi:protein of unknown function [Candidatus Hydrogenisulfobacillus filiaventi]|uniref:Tyrosine recombinase XerC n=1 Tax=Candidatus Hydrogenisulfobacillus filiaventi TaxID=2707344 RepID=A0A6F8ZH11_9FIRM|nr:protein of unknown function [Candidatus Hydrogenisulfobacillus filiaventi]